jgi:hypothetical protein
MKKLKKVIAALASACLLVSALAAVPASAERPLELKGDLNLDGVVDWTDYAWMYTRVYSGNYVQYLGGSMKYNADIDNNGHVDYIDLITLEDWLRQGNATTKGRNAVWGVMKGDVNVDGKVDSQDLNAFMNGQYYSGTQKYNADVDNNGFIDRIDRDTLTRRIYNWYY